MTLDRKFEVIAEIPAEEGPVKIGSYRGVVVIVCNGPVRYLAQREDGSYELKELDLKK